MFIDNVFKGQCSHSSPNLEFEFIKEIIQNFDHLVQQYNQNQLSEFYVKPGFKHSRNDYKYLWTLYCAVESNVEYPRIVFELPPLNKARWNSAASYFLMAWFLLPKQKSQFEEVKCFLQNVWCPRWFQARSTKIDFAEMASLVTQERVKKILMKNHTIESPSLMVPLTNEVAERSLGRVTNVKQPQPMKIKTDFKKLTKADQEKFLKKFKKIELSFLSYVS